MQVDMSMINKMMPVTLSIIIDKGKIWRIIIVANKHKMKSKAILPIKNILRRLILKKRNICLSSWLEIFSDTKSRGR